MSKLENAPGTSSLNSLPFLNVLVNDDINCVKAMSIITEKELRAR